MKCVYNAFILGLLLNVPTTFGLYDFPEADTSIPSDAFSVLSEIPKEKYMEAIELAERSINRQDRLEENLCNSNVLVANGSVSHAQLLESLPSELSMRYDAIARKILQSSLQILNSECYQRDIKPDICAKYLQTIPLPKSKLSEECSRILVDTENSVRAYRRLLPAKYHDSFYEMFDESDAPRPIVYTKNHADEMPNDFEENEKNLALVQWAQFIEHDISKPVVTTMKNGAHIECCSNDSNLLRPRHIHPACAPLKGVPPSNPYESTSCKNYVRGALAVNPGCKFGPAEMLNLASDVLDLSQLYGFSKKSKDRMRKFSGGLLKSSGSQIDIMESLLPLSDNPSLFCVSGSTKQCYMAGDSRVNSNPLVIIIYTTFLRSHNKIAKELNAEHPSWSDEKLYNAARDINIQRYREIVYNEWLPAVLGSKIASKINNGQVASNNNREGVSNEFAVAAIRFYYSMLPNELRVNRSQIETNEVSRNSSQNILTTILLSEHSYVSDYPSEAKKFDDAIDTVLKARAKRMDSHYEKAILRDCFKTSNVTSGTDCLAIDIQRGRDHGIASYIKYLEICTGTSVKTWRDLSSFISDKELRNLRDLYNDLDDIDLIVGGISENPLPESTVGPTFTCILAEQFSNSRRVAESQTKPFQNASSSQYLASRLICETTSLMHVQQNIFFAPSTTNPLVNCSSI